MRDAYFQGDGVGCQEAETPDVAAEPVGVLLDDGDGVHAVLPVDARCLSGADAVGLEEDHHVADALLGGPRVVDQLHAHLADPLDLHEAARGLLDDLQRVGAEAVDDLLRVDLADALDEAAGEEASDAFCGGRRHADDLLRLEAAAVLRMGDPAALCG